jgi:hypothetical protein
VTSARLRTVYEAFTANIRKIRGALLEATVSNPVLQQRAPFSVIISRSGHSFWHVSLFVCFIFELSAAALYSMIGQYCGGGPLMAKV